MYADDLQVYLPFAPADCDRAVARVNEDLESISTWCNSNCLTINPNKSQFMVIGSPKNIAKLKDINTAILINGQPITRVDTAKNLGLVIDSNLKFERHIAECARNSFYRLKLLHKIRPYLSERIRITLCEALVLSRLNYCDTVYGPCLLSRTSRLIQRVQNSCARFCFTVPPRSHITPYLNDANMLKMEARRKLHLTTMLFGVITTMKPKYLYLKLEWARHHSRYPRRELKRPCIAHPFERHSN
ncbi:hypothetical protein ABMA27_008175 [Loxostege sticticalis]|uniref:Reverse transcriptase domain-containing protein n=1 Tax=Loxostege sticticalis TaxID=481309 RepID=A0ABR3HE99_LOXSC